MLIHRTNERGLIARVKRKQSTGWIFKMKTVLLPAPQHLTIMTLLILAPPPSFSHSQSPVRPVPGPSNSHNHSDDGQSIDENSPANHHGSKRDRMKFLKSLAEDKTYSEILKGLAGMKVCLHPFTVSNTNIYPGNRYTREAHGWFPRMGIVVLGQ